jgi:protein-L-isoaspartate O-methyltransferase
VHLTATTTTPQTVHTQAFRAVNRVAFLPPDRRARQFADRDGAIRRGFIHLSAPHIYSRVATMLDFKPEQSFLNIGSGTGYFSAVASLLIGVAGESIGIDTSTDAVARARWLQSVFLRGELDSVAERSVDGFNKAAFLDGADAQPYKATTQLHSRACHTTFLIGDAFQMPELASDDDGEYESRFDRIYVGAGCVPAVADWKFFAPLLRPGGVLVGTFDNRLLRVERDAEARGGMPCLYRDNSL